jgi:hypothetical protein
MLFIATFTWQRLQTTGGVPGVRAGHATVIVGHNMIVTGGYYTTGPTWPSYKDTWILNLRTSFILSNYITFFLKGRGFIYSIFLEFQSFEVKTLETLVWRKATDIPLPFGDHILAFYRDAYLLCWPLYYYIS